MKKANSTVNSAIAEVVMTETAQNRLDKQLDDVAAKAGNYVTALNEHKSPKETKSLKKIVTDAMAEYNAMLAAETYKEWAKEGDVVKTVIRQRMLPHAKKVSFKSNDSGMNYFQFDDAKVKMSLIDVEKYCGSGAFHSERWFDAVQKLAFLIASNISGKLGRNAGFAYIVSESAKAFEFANGVTPTSSEGIQTALQQVFDGILFIDEDGRNAIRVQYQASEMGQCPAWRYIRECMSHQGKDIGSVMVGNTAKMEELVCDAMHIILTHGEFTLGCE